ncbi:MAG: 30S ribosome-binding factor RbfA [Varibaculum cambriense]|uniref:30S ribosome-binding factor RbfA n=1 Tax=Varibaculum cambriense TaxID=184870 RepID=UPI00290ADB8D|nr:30S ribosome-binding factor RbfA [Varibaculum cambriense]MDU5541949.1 30S ribosome-binding factor RbfA [Varibaculum cambriense]MDU7515953.1 30S ribosome-binding factor RbfA [Varibaculum cambriense]
MADQARRRKVEERIQNTVARLLERRIKDPRIGFTTITDCKVTGDLQHATVFYTVFGDEDDRKKTARALNSAKGLIRSEVGKALGIRLTPTIEFALDALPEQAATFEEKLASALRSDQQLRGTSQAASYAGEADPYRKPRQKKVYEPESPVPTFTEFTLADEDVAAGEVAAEAAEDPDNGTIDFPEDSDLES